MSFSLKPFAGTCLLAPALLTLGACDSQPSVSTTQSEDTTAQVADKVDSNTAPAPVSSTLETGIEKAHIDKNVRPQDNFTRGAFGI